MNQRQRRARADFGADAGEFGQADGGIDDVGSAARRPPPSSTTASPTRAGVDGAHEARARRRGRRRRPAPVADSARASASKVRGAAERRDHALEPFRRRAAVERALQRRARRREVRREAARDQRLGGQRQRHLVQPRDRGGRR